MRNFLILLQQTEKRAALTSPTAQTLIGTAATQTAATSEPITAQEALAPSKQMLWNKEEIEISQNAVFLCFPFLHVHTQSSCTQWFCFWTLSACNEWTQYHPGSHKHHSRFGSLRWKRDPSSFTFVLLSAIFFLNASWTCSGRESVFSGVFSALGFLFKTFLSLRNFRACCLCIDTKNYNETIFWFF